MLSPLIKAVIALDSGDIAALFTQDIDATGRRKPWWDVVPCLGAEGNLAVAACGNQKWGCRFPRKKFK